MSEYNPDSEFDFQIVTRYVVVETESGDDVEEFDTFEEALDYARELRKEKLSR